MSSLYSKLHSWPNLLRAYQKAARGKRGRAPAARFELEVADRLIRLRDELRSEIYRPGAYDSFFIKEPKRRLISAAPFRDRVVHHALCAVIEPLFERRFISDTYANRVGKGTHRAIDRCQHFARRFKYVLPCDLRQHFASIDHEILLAILARQIRDPQVLRLSRRILEGGAGVLAEQYEMVYFPEEHVGHADSWGLRRSTLGRIRLGPEAWRV